MKRHSISIVCIGALMLLYGTANADRTIWYVHPDSALNTIQAGLDSCADNEIVLVGPGTYVENIVWPNTQGIHLISELGFDMTIIDGDSAGSVITCTTGVDTTTHIHGFTIQNGRAGGTWFADGGGIVCINSSPSITGNTIANNIAGHGWIPNAHGGGIACINSSPTIKNNSITNNIAHGMQGASGGGIACDSGSSPMIAYNYIASNEAIAYSPGGNAIAYGDYSSPAIIGNVITDNGPMGYGTVSLSVSSGSIIDNIIDGNQSHGIVCMWYSSPAIRGNTITGNSQCGIECRNQSSPYIDSCTLSGNNSHGIYCWDGGDPTVIHCNIHGNSGYAIANEDWYVTISAEDNWWGDPTGPYHPDSNPGGLGDTVSGYVDFTPWLTDSVHWFGVEEQPIVKHVERVTDFRATIFSGPLQLPEGKKCKVFDITGRVVDPDKIQPGIYFIEVDGVVTQKVVKLK